MFSPTTYSGRRKQLVQALTGKGLVLLLGNNESPMNYTDNVYPYRQDSNFLYFSGIDHPHFAMLIDLDSGTSTLYGDDLSLDYIVWMGAQPSVADRASAAGIEQTAPYAQLAEDVTAALGKDRTVHHLPPYRSENQWAIGQLLGQAYPAAGTGASEELVRAVVNLRSYKSDEEIAEMERAVNITGTMHRTAMRSAKPGQKEAAVAGIIEGIAIGAGGRLSYPCIATINGHILHNHYHGNEMKDGQLLLIDAGAETTSRYAGDVTRTFPVGKQFTKQQQEIYELVLDAEEQAIKALKPGTSYRDIHLLSAKIIATGLKELGLMKGDPEEAVAAGAHALFFPHGLGHMIGLDVHDMEDLGEDLVGYTDAIKRSDQFGLRSLRLGRELEEGFVLTVEPGIYFIPALIDRWQADQQHTDFINYDALQAYRNFGGIRIEDNVLVTGDGYRILGNPIPKTVVDIEALRAEALA